MEAGASVTSLPNTASPRAGFTNRAGDPRGEAKESSNVTRTEEPRVRLGASSGPGRPVPCRVLPPGGRRERCSSARGADRNLRRLRVKICVCECRCEGGQSGGPAVLSGGNRTAWAKPGGWRPGPRRRGWNLVTSEVL